MQLMPISQVMRLTGSTRVKSVDSGFYGQNGKLEEKIQLKYKIDTIRVKAELSSNKGLKYEDRRRVGKQILSRLSCCV